MKFVGAYQNTKTNQEDLALTPYLFLVYLNKSFIVKIYGIGICWLHHSVYLGIGFGIPKGFKCFKILK